MDTGDDMHDDHDGYLYGDKHYHAAPSGPLADSEAVYDIEGFSVDYMTKTAEEECPNCGEKHGDSTVVAQLIFKDDKPVIISLDPVSAIRLGNELVTFGSMIAFGPPTLDLSRVNPDLLRMMGIDPDSLDLDQFDVDDDLDMPDDEELNDTDQED